MFGAPTATFGAPQTNTAFGAPAGTTGFGGMQELTYNLHAKVVEFN